MIKTQTESLEQVQRVQAELEPCRNGGKRVKIRVENYDERLGWYTSGSLTLPLHQLPLLEQALADMRSHPAGQDLNPDNIIPFAA